MAIVGAAAIGATATIGSGLASADASRSAANKQIDATNAANAQQRADQKPWMDAGKGALATLTTGLAPGGDFSKPFTMADATNSVAEQHALDQGTQAIQNSAAARGGLLNSNTLQDLTTFGQSNAATFENQAFNQWLQSRQQQLNANQSLAGLGQSSATNVADTGAGLTVGAGNAQAAGTVGQANAVQNTAGQIGQLAGLFGVKAPGQAVSTSPMNVSVTDATGIDPNGMLGGSTTAGDYSDERLKEDVVQVGMTNDGLPIYRYRMKGGGPVKMGVMAQDVEKVKPSAVKQDRQGFKMVDYARVT